MFYFLLIIATLFFLLHAGLLLTSFPRGRLAHRRYFFSHLTLWLTGLTVLLLALLFSGTGRSAFLDELNTPLKKGMILVFTLLLSAVAHGVTHTLVLPLMRRKRLR